MPWPGERSSPSDRVWLPNRWQCSLVARSTTCVWCPVRSGWCSGFAEPPHPRPGWMWCGITTTSHINWKQILTISTTLCILSRSEKYSTVSGSSRYKWLTAVVAWHPWAITEPKGHFRNLMRSPGKDTILNMAPIRDSYRKTGLPTSHCIEMSHRLSCYTILTSDYHVLH